MSTRFAFVPCLLTLSMFGHARHTEMRPTADQENAGSPATHAKVLANQVFRSDQDQDAVAGEHQVLQRFPARWRRLSDTVLVYIPIRGDSILFVDSREEGWRYYKRYLLQDHLPEIPAFLVKRNFWEGYDYLLIDEATGRTLTDIDEIPVFSPSGERFVSVCMGGLAASFFSNRIEIYRLTATGLIKEFSIDTTPWGASDPHWLDDGTIGLTKHTDWTPLHSETEAVLLVLANGEWELKEDVH